MKKLLFLIFLALPIGIVFSQSIIDKKSDSEVLSADDFNGYTMLDTIQNIATVTEYFNPKLSGSASDNEGYAITLLKITVDSLALLPGQKEFLQSLNDLSQIMLNQIYVIRYSYSIPERVFLQIFDCNYYLIKDELEDIMGAFRVQNKVFFVMKGDSSEPNVFLNMLKDTGENLNIVFKNVPQEDYFYMNIDLSTDVTGSLDSTKFEVSYAVVKNKVLKDYY